MNTETTKAKPMHIELERDAVDQWTASIECLPGVMAYGATHRDAIREAKLLAARMITNCLAHDEYVPPVALAWFYCEGDYRETTSADDPGFEAEADHVLVTVPDGLFVRILDAAYQASRAGKLTAVGYKYITEKLLKDLREATDLARPAPFEGLDVPHSSDDIEASMHAVDELRRLLYRTFGASFMRFAKHVPGRAGDIRAAIVLLESALQYLADGLENGFSIAAVREAEGQPTVPWEEVLVRVETGAKIRSRQS